MQLLEAAISVARVTGSQADPEAQALAKDAIRTAIRDWNSENNWEYKFLTETVTLAASAQDIVIPGLKRVHTVRTTSPAKKTLRFARQRLIDYTTRDQEAESDPVVYITLENSEQVTIRVFPIPEASTEFAIRYYGEIAEPEEDEDIIDVPARYLTGLLARAKYYFLLDYDTQTERCQRYESLSEVLMRRAIKDDKKQPDEQVQSISRAEYGSAFGYVDDDLDFQPSDLL